MTNKNDNRERKNKYPKGPGRDKNYDIQHDPTPETNDKYGAPNHKN